MRVRQQDIFKVFKVFKQQEQVPLNLEFYI